MAAFWTREFLMRRIDRCYLIASWARMPERRAIYLDLARHYRRMLEGLSLGQAAPGIGCPAPLAGAAEL